MPATKADLREVEREIVSLRCQRAEEIDDLDPNYPAVFNQPQIPVERFIQQCGAWFTLVLWVAAIVLRFFGILTWWISIPIAIVWQGVNGLIAIEIMKRILPPIKFLEVMEKVKRGETL
jgi:hypothetical protein